MQLVWEACEHYLFETKILYGVRIHAFVLMGNHFHLVLSTPECNLSDAMEYFQSRIARQISALRGGSSVRFQARYRWSIVKTESYFLNLMAYVYLNPVRAGIVKHPQNYKFSSLIGLIGKGVLRIPIAAHSLAENWFWDDPFQMVDWFSTTVAAVLPEKITRGLRRPVFSI